MQNTINHDLVTISLEKDAPISNPQSVFRSKISQSFHIASAMRFPSRFGIRRRSLSALVRISISRCTTPNYQANANCASRLTTTDFRPPISAASFQFSAFSCPGQRRRRFRRMDRAHLQDRDLSTGHDLSNPAVFCVWKSAVSALSPRAHSRERRGFRAEFDRDLHLMPRAEPKTRLWLKTQEKDTGKVQ